VIPQTHTRPAQVPWMLGPRSTRYDRDEHRLPTGRNQACQPKRVRLAAGCNRLIQLHAAQSSV